MPRTSESRMLVLHGVRLAGLVETERVAATTGVHPDEVDVVLTEATDGGLARRRDGRVSGWMLTAQGRAEAERLLATDLAARHARQPIEFLYRRFLSINAELLAACTAWQVRNGQDQLPNDHTDAAYDAAVVGRLTAVDDAVQPLCLELGATLARFDRYGPRLAAARSRVEAGAVDWFASPRVDSYHTAWFELHEDLLATLGIVRSSEVAGS